MDWLDCFKRELIEDYNVPRMLFDYFDDRIKQAVEDVVSQQMSDIEERLDGQLREIKQEIRK